MELPDAESLREGPGSVMYSSIFQECIKQIKSATGTWTIFQVPLFVVGEPDYKYKSCLKFVIFELLSKRYNASFIKPNYIRINWGKGAAEQSNAKSVMMAIKRNPDLKLKIDYS